MKAPIQNRMKELTVQRRLRPNVARSIGESLESNAHGMFLWVVLIMNDLETRDERLSDGVIHQSYQVYLSHLLIPAKQFFTKRHTRGNMICGESFAGCSSQDVVSLSRNWKQGCAWRPVSRAGTTSEGNLKFLYGLSSDSLAHKNKSVLSTKQLGIPSKHFQKFQVLQTLMQSRWTRTLQTNDWQRYVCNTC